MNVAVSRCSCTANFGSSGRELGQNQQQTNGQRKLQMSHQQFHWIMR